LLAMSTMTNLEQVKGDNPDHRFVSQIIVPPTLTIKEGFERLLMNTLAQVCDGFHIARFGTSCYDPDDEDGLITKQKDTLDSECADFGFIIHMVKNVAIRALRFDHLGTDEHWSKFQELKLNQKKIKFFNKEGDIDVQSSEWDLLDDVQDKTVIKYDLKDILRRAHLLLKQHDLEHLEIHANFSQEDCEEDIKGFGGFCESCGLELLISEKKLFAERSRRINNICVHYYILLLKFEHSF